MTAVTCPLCRQRKARRSCPAVGEQICPVCCGTKRLVEIACPPDCPYLASARVHPPAQALRQQESDYHSIVHSMRDLDDRQSRLFLMLMSFLASYASGRSGSTDPSADLSLTAILT